MRKRQFTFIVMIVGLFLTNRLSAQTAYQPSRARDGGPGLSLRFIEDIEVVPSVTASASVSPVTDTRQPSGKERSAAGRVGEGKSHPSGELAPAIENCASIQFKYALLMNREVEALNNLPLYSVIDEWYGTRYLYGGSTKNGIDCSSFCGKVYASAFGINLPRTARDQYAASKKLQRSELKEGDLVFFNTRGGISHVGVYLGDDYFVHSSTHQGVTISKLTDTYYQPRFLGGGRMADRD